LRSGGGASGPCRGTRRRDRRLARVGAATARRVGDPAVGGHARGAGTRTVPVFSGRNFPDASYAGPLVLAALRGVGDAEAAAMVTARRRRPPQRGAGNGLAVGAVGNGPLIAGYGGVVQRVFSTAVMPDGTRTELDVTLRVALTGDRARPYKVLDWRTESASTE